MFPTALRRTQRLLQNVEPRTAQLLAFNPRQNKKLKADAQRAIERRPANANKFLERKQMRPSSRNQKPQNKAFENRMSVLRRVREVIAKRFGPAYKVDTFGSVKYGAVSPKSDMDLIILDLGRSTGFNPLDIKPLPKIYSMRALAKALRLGGFLEVKAILASVPIVKFRDRFTGIECDINVNDQPGYWNSLMIRQYTKLCPHLLPLLRTIKLWAQPLGLNSPSIAAPGFGGVSFSSYAFALMTIAFLQQRHLLPNLQNNIDPEVKEHLFWNRKPVHLCDLRFNRSVDPMPGLDKVNIIDLMGDWFELWSNFDPTTQMVDIRLGGILPRLGWREGYELLDAEEHGTLQTTDPTSCVRNESDLYNVGALRRWERDPFLIVDPFIRIRNVTGNISDRVFAEFQKGCRHARAELRRRQSDQGGVAM